MSTSTGRYYRWNLHLERARRQSVLLQRSLNGRPVYVESADFTDWARITRKASQRIAQIFGDAMDGEDAWKLEVLAGENNFTIKGGDNTDEGAAAAWVGGFRALLYRDTDYQCVSRGDFNEVDAFNIHHRVTSVSEGALVDVHSKYTVGALVGQTVTIAGAGSFTVTGNTATQVLLDGFDPADFPELGARPFYYIDLFAPVADFDQEVFLDVHLEDWGVAEDSTLNHNPGVPGKEVECARREVLIQRLWVRQKVLVAEMPTTSTYVDATATRHWVMKVGELNRLAEDASIPAVDPNGDHFPAPDDVRNSRTFQFACDVEPALSLAERLMRDTSVITVGPSTTLGTFQGMYNGAQGLLDALACDAAGPRTVFVRHGSYDLTSIEGAKLVVRQGWKLIGETPNTSIFLNPDAGAESVLVGRHARIENLSLLRNNDSGVSEVAVHLAGRGASLSRVFIQDLKVGGTALLIQGSAATGGALVEDVDVYKAAGIGVRFSQVVGEPSDVSQGGTAFGTPYTSVVGSPPAATVDGGTAASSTYNTRMVGSRVQVVTDTFDATMPAVYVGAGDSVEISGCAVLADGCPALVVATKLAGAGAPSTWTTRGATFISGSVFLIQPSAAYAAASTFGASIVSGRASLQDVRLEMIATGGAPTSMLRIQPGGELVDVDVDGCHVRSTSSKAVSVFLPSTSAARVRLRRVDSVPVSAASGPTSGFTVVGESPRSVCELDSCRVLGWSGMTSGFAIIGNADLVGCLVDGSDVASQAMAGPNPEAASAGFYVSMPSDSETAPRLSRCRTVGMGDVGFQVHAQNAVNPQVTNLTDCHVDGRGRTAVGFLATRYGRMQLTNCAVDHTRGASVRKQNGSCHVSVIGGRFTHAGLGYLDAGSFPAEDASFQLYWAAHLSHVDVARECKVGEAASMLLYPGAVGIVPGTDGTVMSCDVAGLDHGVLVESACRIDQLRVTSAARSGILIRDTSGRVTVGSASIVSEGLVGVWVVTASHVRVCADVQMTGKSSIGMLVAESNDVMLSGDVEMPDNHNSPAVSLSANTNVTLRKLEVRGSGAQGVEALNGRNLTLEDVDVNTGRVGFRSVSLDNVAGRVHIRRSQLFRGVVADNCGSGGGVLLEDIRCKTLGAAILTPNDGPGDGGSGYNTFRRVVVENTLNNGIIDASGIFFGSAADRDTLLTSSWSCEVEDCEVIQWHQIGGTMSIPADALFRSAAICLRTVGTNAIARVKGCTIHHNAGAGGLGILAGRIDYIADTVHVSEGPTPDDHLWGVARLHVEECRFLSLLSSDDVGVSPLLVAGLRMGCHVIKNCHFDRNSGYVGLVYIEREGGDAVDWPARVDFKGNSSGSWFIDGHLPSMLQSAYVALDGGLSPAEWNTFPADVAAHNAAIRRTNSIRAIVGDGATDVIGSDGSLP